MKDDDNKSFWQRFARLYAPMMRASAPLYQEICGRISLRLTPEMNVLELACGSGQLSFSLAEQVQLWEATDFSPAMIAEARKPPAPASLRFSVQDATDLPYGDHTFDAVVIANALHIMPCPDRALAEIRRVLKPEGFLFAPTFMKPTSALGRFRMQVMSLAGFRTFHPWDVRSFTAYLTVQGFTVIRQDMLGGGLLPLCCAEAKPTPVN